MSRDLKESFKDQLVLDAVQPFFALQLHFDTQTLKFWTGLGDLTVDGHTYVGSGSMIQISELNETADISAQGATITLSGIPSNVLSLALSEPYQGRLCKIFFGVLDVNGSRLLQEDGELVLNENGRPIELSASAEDVIAEVFTGYIDMMNIDEGAETSTISVEVESRLIDLQKPRARRFTHESQRSRFPNDKSFEFIEDLQDKKFQWGR